MNYFFIRNENNRICGYTETRIDESDLCIDVEDPSQDLIDNFIKYKYENGAIVKMNDDEFKELYPNYGIEQENKPSEQDKINAMLMKEIAELKAGAAQ